LPCPFVDGTSAARHARVVDDADPGDARRVAIGVDAHEGKTVQVGGVRAELSLQLRRLGTRRHRQHLGAAVVQLGPEAHEEIEGGWTGDGLAEVRAEGLARDASDHLADEEPLHVDEVSVAGTGLPPRCLGGEGLRHEIPAAPRVRRERPGDGRKSRLVRQQVPHRKTRLAGLGELGPVPRDRRVQIEPAVLDETERAHGRDGLPDGVEVDDRVTLPGARPGGVGVAAPHVHHGLPVEMDSQGRADLRAVGEDLGERPSHRHEAGLAAPAHDRVIPLAPGLRHPSSASARDVLQRGVSASKVSRSSSSSASSR
jgi:hypothetical protein